MRSFEYFAPRTLKEALTLLSRYGEQAKVMAGGTDLLVQMQSREVKLEQVIDLKRIPGLNKIKHRRGEGLELGALATVRDVETSEVIKEQFVFSVKLTLRRD